MTVLKFPRRKTLLELNQDEIERATVEWQRCFRAVTDAKRKFLDVQSALEELRKERQKLLSKS